MAQENTQGQAPAGTTPPGELPVVGDKKLFTHTMKEDIARSKMDPAAFVKEMEAKKPFAQFIPPAPTPEGEASADKFREVIEPLPDRDQPFPLPETPAEPATPQFQVRIPEQKRGLSATTIILASVLLLLIGGGAAAYWWFFMRAPQSEVIVQIPERPAPAPQPIEPQPIPIPEPTPQPEPIPAPEPIPEPIEEPATTTPAIEPTATTTPPVEELVVPPPAPEPAPQPEPVVEASAPEAVLALDRTITITLSANTKTEILEKLAAENAAITNASATIRYVFQVTTPTGNTYLSGADIAGALGLAIPQSIQSLALRTDLVGYKHNGMMRYGFASLVTDAAAMRSAVLAWETTMLDDLTGLYIETMYEKPAAVAFSSNTYRSFYKRYMNLPEPDTSLDWAASNTYFIVATSKDMIFALIDKASQSKK